MVLFYDEKIGMRFAPFLTTTVIAMINSSIAQVSSPQGQPVVETAVQTVASNTNHQPTS